jgi:hypothetical protein
MAAEPWPTEDAATKAVDAAARKVWELNRGALTRSLSSLDFDDLPVERQLEIRNSVLTVVWAALEALPDPRYVAWAQGFAGGYSDGGFDASGFGPYSHHENPYPSGL